MVSKSLCHRKLEEIISFMLRTPMEMRQCDEYSFLSEIIDDIAFAKKHDHLIIRQSLQQAGKNHRCYPHSPSVDLGIAYNFFLT